MSRILNVFGIVCIRGGGIGERSMKGYWKDWRSTTRVPEAWNLVQKAYAIMERRDCPFEDALDSLPNDLTAFARELVIAAFAAGRLSYADDCIESREVMRVLRQRPLHINRDG